MGDLEYTIPSAIFRSLATESQRTEFHRMCINKELKYSTTYCRCAIYYNVTKNDIGEVLFFNYWGMHEGDIYMLGLGGYIPIFHSEEEIIYEFCLKKYEIEKLGDKKE